jgi:hypothetical protein
MTFSGSPDLHRSLAARFLCGAVFLASLGAAALAEERFLIGWATADLTPDNPVPIRTGVVSAGVLDPITATALAFESVTGAGATRLVLVSCDFQVLTDGNRYPSNMIGDVRALVAAAEPDIRPEQVILNATHTHCAPSVKGASDYTRLATRRIADAVLLAWRQRAPGGISFGLGQAVTSHNRVATYLDGSSHMTGTLQKGSTANTKFSHLEGSEDHAVHLLYTWNSAGALTGVVINNACPSQVQGGDKLSADYWSEVRAELARRLGPRVFILPQLSAAGELATAVMVEKKGEERMRQLMFPDADERRQRRLQIATRLCDAVTSVLPFMEDMIDWQPPLAHATRHEDLPAGFPEPDPAAPPYRVELHAIRLGDIAMLTNPFELYLDYGVRIKGRSPAVQTFLVQLCGSGTYLPTVRAVAGAAYGAIPRTSVVSPVAGQQLVESSLQMLHQLWSE